MFNLYRNVKVIDLFVSCIVLLTVYLTVVV